MRASRSSRVRRAASARTTSTLRPCVWVRRYVRRDPRPASNRSGAFQSRRNTSCTTSSASARSPTIRPASPNAAAACRRYTSDNASWRNRPIATTSWASLATRSSPVFTSSIRCVACVVVRSPGHARISRGPAREVVACARRRRLRRSSPQSRSLRRRRGGPMDFDLPVEAETYRDEVRAFLREHAPDGRFPPDWNVRLVEAGYVAPHWPKPWGRDANPVQQLVIDEELRAAEAPRPLNPIGIGWAGPTLLVAGTQEQQERYLPGILSGSELWCQLFSEPGAGSDLASLTTRAERDGDEYVVHGQKVWTTFAHVSQYGILLARTYRSAEQHKGISYFVLDMRSPGITVQPIRQMDGNAMFNEVFLDAVRIPANDLVGEENDGWRLAKVTLGNERVSLSGEGALWGRGPTANTLLDVVR